MVTSILPECPALRARWRKGGLHRAQFWRALGFPNLVKAREISARNRKARKLLEEARRFSPFALDPRDTTRGY
jgi:hypothetical protein